MIISYYQISILTWCQTRSTRSNNLSDTNSWTITWLRYAHHFLLFKVCYAWMSIFKYMFINRIERRCNFKKKNKTRLGERYREVLSKQIISVGMEALLFVFFIISLFFYFYFLLHEYFQRLFSAQCLYVTVLFFKILL